MQKYSFIGLTIILFSVVVSCREQEKLPEDLIDQDRMVEILKVIYVSEVKAAELFDLKVRKTEYMQQYLYPAIFDSMNVTDSAFYHSYDWYESHPDIFEVLMDSVAFRIDRLPTDTSETNFEDDRTLEEFYNKLRQIESVKTNSSQ